MILRRMFSDAVGYSREGGNMIHFRILYKKVQQGYLRAFAGHILQTRHESINVSFAAAASGVDCCQEYWQLNMFLRGHLFRFEQIR